MNIKYIYLSLFLSLNLYCAEKGASVYKNKLYFEQQLIAFYAGYLKENEKQELLSFLNSEADRIATALNSGKNALLSNCPLLKEHHKYLRSCIRQISKS